MTCRRGDRTSQAVLHPEIDQLSFVYRNLSIRHNRSTTTDK